MLGAWPNPYPPPCQHSPGICQHYSFLYSTMFKICYLYSLHKAITPSITSTILLYCDSNNADKQIWTVSQINAYNPFFAKRATIVGKRGQTEPVTSISPYAIICRSNLYHTISIHTNAKNNKLKFLISACIRIAATNVLFQLRSRVLKPEDLIIYLNIIILIFTLKCPAGCAHVCNWRISYVYSLNQNIDQIHIFYHC